MSDTAAVRSAAKADLAAHANALFARAVAGPREQLGDRLFRMSLTAWENPRLRPQLLEKIRSATLSEEGAAELRDHFTAMLVTRLGEVVTVPRLNLNAVVAQIVGMIMLRYVMKMEPIASASVDELAAAFAPTIQRHLEV